MKLVNEDEHGAYLGVSADFLQEFMLRESNPNFEVFDSRGGYSRFIAVKSSRVPDDQDLEAGRYGIDFNRAKPELQEAIEYGNRLPDGLEWLSDIAFVANTREEYDIRSSIWEEFYSYIWGVMPQTIWVAPHSGSVNRAPDNILPFPKLWIDAFTAGVAATCAVQDRNKAIKRILIAIHSTGQLGAVLNLGDFGVVEQEKLDLVAKKMELKYHEKAQVLADQFKQDFYQKTYKILEHINKIRGTLDPEKLDNTSKDDSFRVRTYIKCLKFYGQEIKEFTFTEFTKSLQNLGKVEVPVVLNNYIYPARNVGRLLKLANKIGEGLLHSALHIEGARLYMARDPELVANMILDIRNELFG